MENQLHPSRNLRISKAYKNGVNVPSIRLIGKWLHDAGLSFGDDVEVIIDKETKSLTIIRAFK